MAEDLFTDLRRTVAQLAAFNDIAKALTSTIVVDEVLALIGERVAHLLGADRCALLLGDDDGVLSFAVVRGVGAEALASETLVSGEGIAGTVFQTGKSRLLDDAQAEPDFSPRFDALTKLVSGPALAVPLALRGRVLGVLELVNARGHRPFTDDDLRAAATIADFAAIALDNARNFARVQELTVTDEHTGVANARHLRHALDAEIARSKRFARPVSLLFLDLDHFKQVNDTRGHLAGSRALRQAALLLRETVRGVDTVCRYGGDEFAVLLLETGGDGARKIAHRIVEAFRGASFDVGEGAPLHLTVSVGSATFPDHGQSTEALIGAADRAMYAAKAAGRDRFEAL